MKPDALVVDTNVLISAFIAESTTRELLRDLDLILHAPDKLRDEVEQYDPLIREKSGLSESELGELKDRLFEYVTFVPSGEIEPYRDEAIGAIGHVDRDGVIFVATGLAIDGTIWSDDGDFQKQDEIPVVTTSELVSRLRW